MSKRGRGASISINRPGQGKPRAASPPYVGGVEADKRRDMEEHRERMIDKRLNLEFGYYV